jgi:hypothetical protein
VAMLWAQTMGLLRPHEGLICRFSRGLRSAAALSDDEIDALMAPIPKRARRALRGEACRLDTGVARVVHDAGIETHRAAP